ncbi:MAG: phenylacetate--CoA ligase family protein [Burkholderiales bacterium]
MAFVISVPPILSRALVYPLQERFLGRPTMEYLADLERTQWLSRKEIEALQERKLEKLLRLAYTHCPWHARRFEQAGVVPERFESLSLSALQKIPTMTKEDARANAERMVWRGVPGGAHAYNTGGSSGAPLQFHFGRRRQASDAAGRIRARRWWGAGLGDREVYLWGAPVELGKTDRIKTVRDRLLNQLVLNAFEMSPRNMDEYLDAIEDYKPSCIYGYASSIALLAAHADARGRHPRLSALKVVCTTGEPLYPHQRELIGRVFKSTVANEFGSRDIGFTAHETPAGQMLLMSESIVLEVLRPNGEPVPAGEMGEAVVTGLCSDAQPFIRYRTGDMIRMSGERCKEGRGLHVIEEVTGRTTDFVVRADGTIMHALALIYVLRSVSGVAEFKIIQHRVEDIEVRIVTNNQWKDDYGHHITTGLQSRLGSSARVSIRLVDSIPVEASGKYRYVVSHVGLSNDLASALRTAAVHS